jgi:hypothetical protein
MDLSRRIVPIFVLLALTCIVSGRVRAESLLPAPVDVAGNRPQPEYDALNIRAGSWIIAPQLRTDAGYDSNLFGTRQDPVGDGYARLSPRLDLRSDWERHALDFAASATATRYANHPRQRSNDFALHARGQLDLGRTLLTFSVSESRISERRGANGAPLTVGRPSQYRLSAQQLEVRTHLSPLALSLSASHERTIHSDLELTDGTVQSQAFRDSNQWSVQGGAIYAPSDIAAIGLVAQYRHASTSATGRSDDQASVEGRLALDTGMLRVEADVGYLRRSFSNPALKDFDGLLWAGSVTWYPTTLLTLTARTGRTLENSAIPAVGAIDGRSWRLQADYELLRNLVLSATYGHRRQKFPEIGRRILLRNAEIRGEYRFNRTVAIAGYAQHECRDSSDAALVRPYCGSLIGASLTFRR